MYQVVSPNETDARKQNDNLRQIMDGKTKQHRQLYCDGQRGDY